MKRSLARAAIVPGRLIKRACRPRCRESHAKVHTRVRTRIIANRARSRHDHWPARDRSREEAILSRALIAAREGQAEGRKEREGEDGVAESSRVARLNKDRSERRDNRLCNAREKEERVSHGEQV